MFTIFNYLFVYFFIKKNFFLADQIFRLLSDSDINVVMKTLGLLRNLVTHKSQIDHVMSLYGKQIMQAVVLILESDNNAEVKEQALCILANIGNALCMDN